MAAKTKLRATIDDLKRCQQARALGVGVSYTTDPAWLVNVAINRRAGWPDDPSHSRGSCMPVNGKFPPKGGGDGYRHLCQLARAINSPRLRVYPSWLGEWKAFLLKRLPQRFVRMGED